MKKTSDSASRKSRRPAGGSFKPTDTRPGALTASSTISGLRHAAVDCKACDLWKTATQTVFGEGPANPTIMFVGEQPGDQEDLGGRPFIGPAGRLLEDALEQAGLERSKVYLTNVVKHFKWAAATRGKRRIHKKPRYSEIHACRPWLDSELRLVKPTVLVCLGSTAAQSLLGRDFSVMRQRGQVISSPLVPLVIATVHPSSILRAPDKDARGIQMRAFIEDLKIVADLAKNNRRLAENIQPVTKNNFERLKPERTD